MMRPSTAVPTTPPPEVMDAITGAALAYERLAAYQRRLSFVPHTDSGGLRVEVRDGADNFLYTIAPSAALRAADGERLEDF
jgi:hypothetical protein